MMLIRLPADLVNELVEISDSHGKPFSVYLTDRLFKDVRAHELNCSLKETNEEAERVEEPSIDAFFERALAKLRPEISESEERRMLSTFLSQIPKKLG